MNEFPKGLRSWIEVAEKLLMIVTLSVGVVKGFGYLSAKTEEAASVAQETKERTKTLGRMTQTYTKELEQTSKDIRDIDANLSTATVKNSVEWDRYQAIRLQKTQDKQNLLEEMGKQIIELHKYPEERPAAPVPPLKKPVD